MNRTSTRAPAAAAALVALLLAGSVQAGDRPPTAQIGEAPRHFDRALSLYEQGNLLGALVEFQRAQEILPSFSVLYNLGLVSQELHDWAAALRYYREYLDRGGEQIPNERRQQLEKTIVDLTNRSGQLDIVVRGGPAEVLLDGRSLAPPWLGVAVNPGRHNIEVRYPRRGSRNRMLEVGGGERIQALFDRPAESRPPELILPASAPRPAPEPPRSPSSPPGWRAATWTWTATALLGTGALVNALLAGQSQKALDRERAIYPAEPAAIARYHYQTRARAMIADTLGAGSLVMAAVSLYLHWSF